ncbi:MFS transporter [Streptomyces sp. RG80]|uniref:MFS transporter n=1 Tax=Streptomyces sp. RG80 TaxID=3157340 RepID=UPI00338E065F
MAAAVTCTVLVADFGGTEYEWTDPVILGLGGGAVLAWVLFILSQSRATEPIIPLRLFRSKIFNIATLLGMIGIGIGMFALIVYMPTYMQMVYGKSATESGLLLIPMIVGLIATVFPSGQLVSRTGRYKIYPILGSAVITVAAWLISTLEVDTPLVQLCAYIFVLGAGIGLTVQNLVVAVQNAFPASDVGTATSSNNFFREIGATIGTAAIGAVFADRLADQLAANIPAAAEGAVGDTESLTPALVHSLPGPVQDAVIESYQHALTPIFAYLAILFAACFVLSFFLPEKPLTDAIPDADSDTDVDSEFASDKGPVVPKPARELELAAGARVHGTVRAGADGRPLADARVVLFDAAGNVVDTSTTGEDGAYGFADLNSGDYTVTASGFPPKSGSLRIDGTGTDAFDIELHHPEE